jgi:hypothetical protein
METLCKENVIKFEVKIAYDREMSCKIKGEKIKVTLNEI